MNKYKWTPLALALAMSASLSHATSNPSGDVDIDNDGLIEIATLQELDLMRYDLAGTSLNGDSTGCPATGCNGYELVNDLDFDTNGNGVADSGDLFWNAGKGWTPVSVDFDNMYQANFNGNSHKISNLYINSTYQYSGFFGLLRYSNIDNLEFVNANVRGGNVGVLSGLAADINISKVKVGGVVDAYTKGGMLVGELYRGNIFGVRAEGTIEFNAGWSGGAWCSLGGLVGQARDAVINKSQFEGVIVANDATTAGGLIGFSYDETEITNSLVINSDISAPASSGGLVGDSFGSLVVENSLVVASLTSDLNVRPLVGDLYVSNDNIQVASSYWNSEVSGIYTATYGQGKTTSELQCPTAPGDVSCNPTSFADWDETVWNFGASFTYPALRWDSDSDGIDDFQDVDIDNDGLIEIVTLQELDLMRYDLVGTSLNGDSTGCPAAGCNGYELVNDLDFDTNGNGVADFGDLFWNAGKGWTPVSVDFDNMYQANFNGNSHKISNLYINSTYQYSGFFGLLRYSNIDNLEFVNANVRGGNVGVLSGLAADINISKVKVGGVVDAYTKGGMLVGELYRGNIFGVRAEGTIEFNAGWSGGAWCSLGGLVGQARDAVINKSQFEGVIVANDATTAGGLIGFSYDETEITNSLVINSDISAPASSGGLVGDSFGSLVVENSLVVASLTSDLNVRPLVGDLYVSNDNIQVTSSYWNTEVSNIYTATYGQGKTTSELQCPTAPGDVSCDPNLFSDWDETVWDFGSSTDYPVLR